jgi:hypothetical protein
MADNKPVTPQIDPKTLASFAFLSSPEGQDFLAAQTELVELQRDELKERRTAIQNQRANHLQARAHEARIQEGNRQRMLANREACTHRHPNNSPALGGQKFARGGKYDWMLRCQLCGKEYTNLEPPPQGLHVAFEAFGGPSF